MDIEQKKNKSKQRRVFIGAVISDKMQKTIVVKVERTKIHPKYHKRFKTHKNYKVHDEKEQYKIGDKVQFMECRPMSREKRWRVLDNKQEFIKTEAEGMKSEEINRN